MTKFASLTLEAMDIVSKYNDICIREKAFNNDSLIKLLVSLYSIRIDADEQVVKILGDYVFNLLDYFSKGEICILQREYQKLAMYCYENDDVIYNKTFDDAGASPMRRNMPRNSTFRTPFELVELCLKIANCRDNSQIYLPFAGTCSFALYQQHNCSFYTADINKKVWAYSKILLSSQNKQGNFELKNCLDECNSNSTTSNKNKYDYIFSFPPFFYGHDNNASLVSTLVKLTEEALKDNGEMYLVLPNTVFVSYCWSKFWGHLLKKGQNQYSMVVVSLPKLFEPYSSVLVSLFIIKKDMQGNICLMDASEDCFTSELKEERRRIRKLKVDSIIETLSNNGKSDGKFVTIGKSSDNRFSESLSPKRYLVDKVIPKEKQGEYLVCLKDVIEILPGTRLTNNSNISSVSIKDLSLDYLRCDIRPSESNSDGEISSSIEQPCLIAVFINRKFKVGRLGEASPANPVGLGFFIFAFKIKSDLISEEFLLRTLLTEYVEKQAMMLQDFVGARFSMSDLLKIKIIVPSLEEQDRICKMDSRALLSKADKEKLEAADEFRRDIHMKKHAIGQTIFNLNNWMKVLQKARKEGNGIVADSATVGNITKTTVPEIYDNLQATIIKLQEQIGKFDRGWGSQKEKISLTEFIENYISKNSNPLFEYIYDSSLHCLSNDLPEVGFNKETKDSQSVDSCILQENSLVYVDFSTKALGIIFDNIISNACCHGFANREGEKNLVKIALYSEGDFYVISISNNGNPITKDISPEVVFSYGKTGKDDSISKEGEDHYGIGGYEIRKLMREFNGDAEFIINNDDEFGVEYKLTFKSTNIV